MHIFIIPSAVYIVQYVLAVNIYTNLAKSTKYCRSGKGDCEVWGPKMSDLRYLQANIKFPNDLIFEPTYSRTLIIHCRKSRPIFRDIRGSVMTCSYMEGNVPKLIVRDIYRNIPRFYRDIEKRLLSRFDPWTSLVRCEYTIH
jgi:hypothetical protein